MKKSHENTEQTEKLNKAEKRTPKPVSFVLRHRDSPWVNLIFSVVVPLVIFITLEWIARGGDFGANKTNSGFFQALGKNFPSFLLAYILLVCVYVFISQLSGLHALATVLTGLLGYVPAVVTHYKLTLRGEPFLPWDLTQIGDLMGVSDSLTFDIPYTVIVSGILLVVMAVLAGFVRVPRGPEGKRDWFARLITSGAAVLCGAILMFAVFLSPAGSKAVGIVSDAWMQDRYYRNNGVITGFLTNLQMLQISAPEGYSDSKVDAVAVETGANALESKPFFENSVAARGETAPEDPDIIYVMAESFWDVTALPGIEYDQPVLENLTRLAGEGAYGQAYTPSFGGGTCDVEFEVLTGYSMEYLPSGSKPFQQYMSDNLPALPRVLKEDGYQTLAIHGYGRRFWNRDKAYPQLGIDEFIASEDFADPERKRGFISDNAMVDRIIEELMAREDDGPMFIHAVTMQNHTTYNRDKYPADELVRVTDYPDALTDSTIGQLEDCATGIRDMDAALGKLCSWLKTRERPTIVVFWGDHMNPMTDGYKLFEATGFIEEGDTMSPSLRHTPLLIWSNFDDAQVELGTLSTYNITAAMMDLYGMDKPLMFEFLSQQWDVMRGRTRGVTVNPDGSTSLDMTAGQEEVFNEHHILQYDMMFGRGELDEYLERVESSSG